MKVDGKVACRKCAAQKACERYCDLNSRQESCRLACKLFEPCSALVALRCELIDLCIVYRNNRYFGTGKYCVDENKHELKQDLPHEHAGASGCGNLSVG